MTELMLNKSLDPGGVRQILSPRSPLSSTQTLNAHSRGRGNCTRGHETVQLWRPRGASGLLAPAVCRLRMLKQPHWIPLWSVTVKLLVFQTWTSDWLEWCIFSLFSRQLNSSFYFHTRHQAGCKLASSVTCSLKRRQMLTLSFPKWPYFQPLDSVFEIFSGLGHCVWRGTESMEVKRAFLLLVATTYFCFCSSSHCDPLGQCSVFILTLGCGTPCRSHGRVMLAVTLQNGGW